MLPRSILVPAMLGLLLHAVSTLLVSGRQPEEFSRSTVNPIPVGKLAFSVGASITSDHVRFPLGAQKELDVCVTDCHVDAGGVEQVHVQMGHDSSTVIVTWNFPGGLVGDACGVYFWVADSAAESAFASCATTPTSVREESTPPLNDDTSLDVRYSVISGLRERTRYRYRILGSTFEESFRTTPSVGSPIISLGVVGDIGQTANSNQTMQHVYALKDEIDMLLHAGDISYADGYQPRWDMYGRLSQFLFSSMPTIYAGGNHEMFDPQWRDFLARYPQDHEASGSNSPFWFSAEHGPAHITVLNPYVPFVEGTEQMAWLRRDFASIDRGKTPWLIVLHHLPWYNSNTYHMGEGDQHRAELEQLFMDSGVDIVFTGHVHSYERWHPTFKGAIDQCGVTHINIGDGGNREGLASNWQQVQPINSAFREDSYGFGVLRIDSSTQARWEWHRNQDGAHHVSDIVTITRDIQCWNSGMNRLLLQSLTHGRKADQ